MNKHTCIDICFPYVKLCLLYILLQYFGAALKSAFVSGRFSRWPVSDHIPPMSPQTQEVPADPVWHHRRSPSHQPTSVPPECQRIPDCHGSYPEDCEEAGQLLQRHHLHQQARSCVWTSPPQGSTRTILLRIQYWYQKMLEQIIL